MPRFKHNRSWMALAAALALTSCGEPKSQVGVYQGYIEGRFLGVAAPAEGQLLELNVRRGDKVEAGAPLFALEPEPESDDVRQNKQQVAAAQSRYDDLKKGLRDTELQSLEAQYRADQAMLEEANLEWQRSEKLHDAQYVSSTDYDRLRLTVDQRKAEAARDNANLETGKLGARNDQICQAAADLAAAQAVLGRSEWLAGEKAQKAPQAGFVQDTLYRVGERVAAGQPVVVLLPTSEVRARFYVPETEIAKIKTGQDVTVLIDGREPVKAKVGFISTQVEFTPPVIYSPEENHKYVFMVEADFDPAVAATLHAGQPAQVKLIP